jgi:hypothetical protein
MFIASNSKENIKMPWEQRVQLVMAKNSAVHTAYHRAVNGYGIKGMFPVCNDYSSNRLSSKGSNHVKRMRQRR